MAKLFGGVGVLFLLLLAAAPAFGADGGDPVSSGSVDGTVGGVPLLALQKQQREARLTAPLTASGTLDISVFSVQQRTQPPADNMTYRWIREKFGVTFSWDILTGDKDQKIKSFIAYGRLPDLVEVDSEKFQRAGCLRDLKPLIEQYAPNLKKHYASVWEKMIDSDSEKDDEGTILREHIYSLPDSGVYDGTPSDSYYNANAFWIQKDVLKEFGYPEITTVDEYFDLIEAYYRKHPTIGGKPTVPFSIITADWEAFNLWNPPNFLAGYPNDGNGHVDRVNGHYVYTDNYTDENAERWFRLANGYYRRGLIDPESFTDSRDRYYAKIAQGRVLGMFMQGWQFMGEPERILRNEGMDERTYVPLPIVFDKSIRPRYRDRPLPNLQRGYGITVKCPEEKAVRILQFMDRMLTEENQKILYWGFRDVDYYIDDDGSVTGTKGAAYRTERQRRQQRDPAWRNRNRAVLWAEKAPRLEGMLPSGYTRNMDDLPWEYEGRFEYVTGQNETDLALWAAYGVSSYAELMDRNPPENPGWYPMWQCSPSAYRGGFEAEAAAAAAGFEHIQRAYLPRLITGEAAAFEKTWAEYCAQMKPLTDVYNAFMQQQLDQRVEKFGAERTE